jgi:predicted DsbA family dithiol-disulfide isomerase
MKAVTDIQHFSDILCVWAYVGQIRVNELLKVFGEEICMEYHFFEVFGDVPGRLQSRWQDRGGLEAYSDHVKEVVAKFDHVSVHDDVWCKVRPCSSLSTHHFLQAVVGSAGMEKMAACAWGLREAFFLHARDISARDVQFSVAEELATPRQPIEELLDNGLAFAGLARDARLASEQSVSVSPTFVFDGGRQALRGNVGYNVIEANVKELQTAGQAKHSWC